ncbi:hypothetical protein chiPu_0016668, partial [Chiloscyllium punctatum]|nr:hypothetical protein [Chiloscyllium punctatum]
RKEDAGRSEEKNFQLPVDIQHFQHFAFVHMMSLEQNTMRGMELECYL